MPKGIMKLKYLFLIMIAGIGAAKSIPNQPALASSNLERLSNTYLNTACTYLYLGETNKDTFDFDIKATAKKNIVKLVWYIKAGKGNPEAVTIDSKTGLVTAKSAGTAYIRCKIVLADHTVLRPEAKVIVRNNIKEVEINNAPADNTLAVGFTMNFDTDILDTAAGKNAKTDGIVRFELKDDTAGAGKVTEDGIVTPTKSGAFTIRAVCFENIEKYQQWLEDKSNNINCVTAASSWITIKVLPTEATAASQKELYNLLASDIVTKIIISGKGQYIVIPEEDYTDKILIIDAANTSIENHAVFKQIIMKSASDTKWNEYAIGNSFNLYDCDIIFNIEKQSRIEYIKLGTQTKDIISKFNNIIIKDYGNLKRLDVMDGSDISIYGTESFLVVNVEGNSETKISSSMQLLINSYANLNAAFLNGAERSVLYIFGNAAASIENLSSDTVSINTNSDHINLSSCYYLTITDEGKTILYNAIDTSGIVKNTPSVFSSVYASAVKSGETLSLSTLNGTFYYNSAEIVGTLSWSEPATIVNTNGYYSWIFTPVDTTHYNTVTGKAFVAINNMP